MASYSVLIKRSAAKEIEALPLKDRRRVVGKIQGLANNPRPPGCEKLSGADKYRHRQGDYRILYQVVDRDLIITVVKVGHRRENTEVDLTVDGDSLVVRPARKEWTLDELLKGVTKSNIPRETDWGDSVGREVW